MAYSLKVDGLDVFPHVIVQIEELNYRQSLIDFYIQCKTAKTYPLYQWLAASAIS